MAGLQTVRLRRGKGRDFLYQRVAVARRFPRHKVAGLQMALLRRRREMRIINPTRIGWASWQFIYTFERFCRKASPADPGFCLLKRCALGVWTSDKEHGLATLTAPVIHYQQGKRPTGAGTERRARKREPPVRAPDRAGARTASPGSGPG